MKANRRCRRACALFPLLLLIPLLAAAGEPCPEEHERAAQVRKRIEREWPLHGDDAVVRYVQDFGLRLARRAGIGQVSDWRISVVRDLSVNAFSIGDGLIYITEGAILAAEDEAELAAILAHEMGHDIAGHFCPRRYREKDEGSWWDFLFSSGDDAPVRDRDRNPTYIGSLRQSLDPEKEREADRLAVKIMHRAGYDPAARIALARHMVNSPGGHGMGELYDHYSLLARSEQPATAIGHPSPEARLRKVQALLRGENR